MTFTTAMRLRLKILLIVLFSLGLFLRLAPVITGNIFFWFDQGLDAILVKILVVDHKINLVSRYSGLQGVLMGPFWTWLMAIPFAFSRGNPASFSIFLSIISLASSALTFIVAKKYFGSVTALFTTGFTLLAPIFVFNSTVAASPHPLTFLFILFIWFTYELFVKSKSFFWIPLLLLIGLFFQFEIGFALFTLPTIIILFLAFRARKTLGRHFLIGTLLLCLTFLPQALFDIRHNFLITNGILKIFSGGNSLYGSYSPLPNRFLERAWSFGDDFLTMAVLLRHWAFVGLLLILMIWGHFLQSQKNFLKVLLIILGTYYVGFSLYPGPLWVWYRAGLPIVYVLLLTIPLGILWEKVKLTRVIILAVLLVISSKAINIQTDIADAAMLKTQTRVLDYIYQSASGQPFSYFIYTPPVYDYVWSYDFWWYGQQKYGYLPQNFQMTIPLLGIGEQAKPPTGEEKLFYLIMEPNRERPWEIAGWKKSFIKTGKTVEAREFPGDVIVEKRTNESP